MRALHQLRSGLLKPLEVLYRGAVFSKNEAYRRSWLSQVKLDTPVISVGNLTMGGTGKTPVVHALAGFAKAHGDRMAIISRNYKAECEGIHKVVTRPDGPSYYGDEPYLLAHFHPEVDVYVGPSKSETAQSLKGELEKNYDLIVIDDGFQHQRLFRDLDVVLIDTSAPLSDYQLLPSGRAREGVSEMFARADHVLLTKCNWASADSLTHWKSLLEGKIPFSELSSKFDSFTNLGTGKEKSFTELPAGERLAFCGLAQPYTFFENCKRLLGAKLPLEKFSDHYSYDEEEIRRLAEQVGEKGWLFTTEKDAIKLLSLKIDHSRIWVSKLEISPLHSIESIYDKAKRSIGSRP